MNTNCLFVSDNNTDVTEYMTCLYSCHTLN